MKRRDFITRSSGMLVALTALPSGLLVADSAHAVTASATLGAQILAHTNAQRRAAGLSPLSASSKLNQVAASYAGRLAAAGRLSHHLGGDPGQRVKSQGIRYRGVAENIAMGNGRGSQEEIAAGLVRQWMGSAGHRKNILSRRYREIGTSAVIAGGRAWGVQIFIR